MKPRLFKVQRPRQMYTVRKSAALPNINSTCTPIHTADECDVTLREVSRSNNSATKATKEELKENDNRNERATARRRHVEHHHNIPSRCRSIHKN